MLCSARKCSEVLGILCRRRNPFMAQVLGFEVLGFEVLGIEVLGILCSQRALLSL